MGQPLHPVSAENRPFSDACGGRSKRKPHAVHAVNRIIARSYAMKRAMESVGRFAPTLSPILLRGEPGSGKDVIARAIHAQSMLRRRAFIKVSCDYSDDEQAIAALLGSDENGNRRPGAVALANGGTLFLSEIGLFSLRMQKCVLRLLQEKEYVPLTGSRVLPCKMRLVCATEKNLEQMVAAGGFLPELYYRLNVAAIALPALRDRHEDIPELVNYFFERFNRVNRLNISITEQALSPLYLCHWPANVRDLENCLEYAALHREGDVIKQLPCLTERCMRQKLNLKIGRYLQAHIETPDAAAEKTAAAFSAPLHWEPGAVSPHVAMPIAGGGVGYDPSDEIRHRIIAALEKSGWVKAKAARLLNLTPRQLSYALQKLQIEVKKF
ncbi:sigma 54-interacting transcriptional regulator [Brenneria populi]|uniref:Sigma 54-interacting transcriptional regulator n=1 Tax=Brenneria populi TaxID=1505588 RepID=A0ABU6JVK1_9GAMM|nr:sigma 54-interacting transcriptional regulator [Brenneria populi Li et al. 2015]